MLLLAFLLIALDLGNRMDTPQDIGQRLTLPAESGLSSVGRNLSESWKALQNLGALRAENETLRRQIDELTLVNVRVIALEAENTQLREQLDFKGDHPNYTLQVAEIVSQEEPATVVGREVSNLAQAIRINQGRESDVLPGMSVVTARGLIGQVVESGQGWAKVLLLTDETSKVTAVTQQGRALGVVEGTNNGLVMRHIPHEQRVEPGDVVLTAGLGGAFPRGLVIGVVDSVERSDINASQEAVVRSTVELAYLEYVFVVRSFIPTPDEPLDAATATPVPAPTVAP